MVGLPARSSVSTETVPFDRCTVAPTGLESLTVNASFPSGTRSPFTVIATAADVAPAANVTVPDLAL